MPLVLVKHVETWRFIEVYDNGWLLWGRGLALFLGWILCIAKVNKLFRHVILGFIYCLFSLNGHPALALCACLRKWLLWIIDAQIIPDLSVVLDQKFTMSCFFETHILRIVVCWFPPIAEISFNSPYFWLLLLCVQNRVPMKGCLRLMMYVIGL